MYYEEKWVDGVLWWRGTPTGDWVRASADELCQKFLALTDTLATERAARETSEADYAQANAGLDRALRRAEQAESELAALRGRVEGAYCEADSLAGAFQRAEPNPMHQSATTEWQRILRPANGLGPGPKLNARQQAELRSEELARQRDKGIRKWMRVGMQLLQRKTDSLGPQ